MVVIRGNDFNYAPKKKVFRDVRKAIIASLILWGIIGLLIWLYMKGYIYELATSYAVVKNLALCATTAAASVA